ncbi:aldehyde dehydrogenase family protein [Wenzhouxiangella sp. AB-CW3]|uniref:aldehyde dehydrogenase family protein n=1 Tax=Wenzhouxiangella sp. AB-CW3 TaxID=2771012 RepID=UPI00168BF4DC|nr:aldehyde dehydrogenase family protein [Wenzhouxiangella sp. AB-CW3]QOC21704.1 aldehyde dehydrogenase family protein [Wenzhouxiangella sp. AB-CW3]
MPIEQADYPAMLADLRHGFQRGLTRPLAWRRQQLSAIESLLTENEPRIAAALAADLGKPEQEVYMGELSLVLSEARHARKRLRRWSRPRRVSTPMVGQPGRSWVQPEPLGVVLIMGAWNYPVQLVLGPLIPALAAGNCAVVKPSEIAAVSSALMAELIPQYLDNDAVRVVEGAVEETTELLKLRFDHILYTGGAHVGRIVMRAAAEHLTPVTLELGGKSPCVVDAGADLKSAARRLTWGKCLNAGQTCIAPDYVLVTPEQREPLIRAIESELEAMYGSDRLGSADFARIINRHHFDRLAGYLDNGRVAIGGQVDEAGCRIEPTVLTDVAADSPVMREEIFGPILPVIAVADLDEAIAYIIRRDKPLAAYLFTRSRDSQRRFVEQVSTGNLCINDVLMFMSVHELPFGGVGMSGMGQYHGRAGFDRFSHLKAVMKRSRFPEVPLRFPPYTALKQRLLKMVG